ncbi:hypothetical protein AGMMS50229_20140 [Campylobacterota bacterium]|nr:hypothetical protein AGMMS50229_20140 [Campylobacterota bacterium]
MISLDRRQIEGKMDGKTGEKALCLGIGHNFLPCTYDIPVKAAVSNTFKSNAKHLIGNLNFASDKCE